VGDALEAVLIHGVYGYLRDFPAEPALGDATLASIGGGTTEIHRDDYVAAVDRLTTLPGAPPRPHGFRSVTTGSGRRRIQSRNNRSPTRLLAHGLPPAPIPGAVVVTAVAAVPSAPSRLVEL
jgi:hypothetical protein